MQQEIERAEIRQFVSLNVAVANPFEMILDARGSDLANQQRIKLRLQSYQADIGSVAFVPRARMRELCKLNPQILRLPLLDLDNLDPRVNLILGDQRRPIRDHLFDLGPPTRKAGHRRRTGQNQRRDFFGKTFYC